MKYGSAGIPALNLRLTAIVLSVLLLLLIAAGCSSSMNQSKAKGENTMTVEPGKKISLEYTLSVDGEQIESNVGQDPLSYTHGNQEIIPGLEKELSGLAPGGKKQVTVSPSEGYGEINPEAVIEVKKEQVPEEARNVGAQLMTQDDQGNVLSPIVKEIKDETIVLDFNHPLAGKTLTFDVHILKVE